jgi:hypothetical protein
MGSSSDYPLAYKVKQAKDLYNKVRELLLIGPKIGVGAGARAGSASLVMFLQEK